MTNGHVPGQAAIDGETQAGQLRRHGIGAAGLGVKAKRSCLLDRGDHRLQPFARVDDAVVAVRRLLRRRWRDDPVRAFRSGSPRRVRRRHPSYDAVELQRGHQRNHLGPLVVAKPGGIEVQAGGSVALDGGQEAVFKRLVSARGQVVLHPLLGYLLQVLVDALQRPIVAQQRRGRLVANSRDTRDVVRFVAHQRLVVGLLLRGQAAVPRRQLLFVHDAPVALAAGQVHANHGRDQLKRIPVARENHRGHVSGLGLAAQRADDVVSLVARQFVDRHRESRHQLFHPVELPPQFQRRRRTLGLVLGEALVPERRARRVESHGHVTGLPLVQRPDENAGEPVHARDVLAGGRNGEVAACADGAERAVYHRVSVDQQQQRSLLIAGGEGHLHGHLVGAGHCGAPCANEASAKGGGDGARIIHEPTPANPPRLSCPVHFPARVPASGTHL